MPSAATWWFAENGQQVGPVTLEQLSQAVGAGRLAPATLVWSQGMASWQPAQQTPQVAGLFGAAPPPVPPGE